MLDNYVHCQATLVANADVEVDQDDFEEVATEVMEVIDLEGVEEDGEEGEGEQRLLLPNMPSRPPSKSSCSSDRPQHVSASLLSTRP